MTKKPEKPSKKPTKKNDSAGNSKLPVKKSKPTKSARDDEEE